MSARIFPVIEPVNLNTWKATTSHTVSRRIWDNLFKIQDHLIEIQRREYDTVLTISTNPGVDGREGLLILLTAVYVSIENDILSLTKITTTKEHLSQMSKLIQFPTLVTEEEIAIYLSNYISKAVDEKLKEALTMSEIRLGYVTDHQKIILDAKMRLEFARVTPLSLFTMPPWERKNRLEKCNTALAYMNAALEQAKRTNVSIGELRQSTNKQISDFKSKYHAKWVSCGKAFQDLLEIVKIKSQLAADLIEEFDPDKTVPQLAQNILAITPPSSAPNSK